MKTRVNSILLIDDDEATNIFTQIILGEANCANHIHAIQSGPEALHYLLTVDKSLRPDLIFLDVNMPAMDGWEFLDEYNKLSKELHSKVIIVMLSTSLSPDDKLKATCRSEVTSFENKPMTEEKITKIISKYFLDRVAEPAT